MFQIACNTALGPGFRPNTLPAPGAGPNFFFTAEIRFDPLPGGGTRYGARVWHPDEPARAAHAALGFEQGWGIALDQLLELMRGQSRD